MELSSIFLVAQKKRREKGGVWTLFEYPDDDARSLATKDDFHS
jgi:hypothetical protein